MIYVFHAKTRPTKILMIVNYTSRAVMPKGSNVHALLPGT